LKVKAEGRLNKSMIDEMEQKYSKEEDD